MKFTYKQLKSMVDEAVLDEMSLAEADINFDVISRYTINDDAVEEGDINEEEEYWDPKVEHTRHLILRRKNWEINNYKRFLEIVNKTPSDLKGFLTRHGYDEITKPGWFTYTLKYYDVAFAVHIIGPGKVDICNLVNNDSRLKGIGALLFTFIKQEGGTQVDNYRSADGTPGRLGTLYRKSGFRRQTWQDKFNPDYLDPDEEWQLDTKKWGTPDIEGLESEKHRMRYNNPFRKKYREKFDAKMKQLTERQLRGYIYENVLRQIDEMYNGVDWASLPKGRPVSMVINSIKSKLRLINFKSLPETSPLKQKDFLIFVKNINNMNDILDKILNMAVQEINNSSIKAAPQEKEWQVADDDSDIFSLLYLEPDEEFDADTKSEAMREVETKINEKLAKTHSTITIDTEAQGAIKLILKLPFDIALYNKEINENI